MSDTSQDVLNRKRKMTHKNRLEALRDFEGLTVVDLHEPKVSSSEQKWEEINSPREFKRPDYVYSHHDPEISPCEPIKFTDYKQRRNSFKDFNGSEQADLHHPKIFPLDQKRVVANTQIPISIRPDNNELPLPEIYYHEQKRETTDDHSPSSLKERNGLEDAKTFFESYNLKVSLLEQNRKVTYEKRPTSKPLLLQEETGESVVEKPIEIQETSSQDPKIETVNISIPFKTSVNQRMAAIRSRNDLEIEKTTKRLQETSSEHPVKVSNNFPIVSKKSNSLEVIVEEIKNPTKITQAKATLNSRIAAIRENISVKIENPTKILKVTFSEDTKKEVAINQHTSLQKFQGLEDFGLVKFMRNNSRNYMDNKVEHTISKPKATSENTKKEIVANLPNSSKGEKGLEEVGIHELFRNINNNNFEHKISDSSTQTSCLQKELIELIKKTSQEDTKKHTKEYDVGIENKVPNSRTKLKNSLKFYPSLVEKSYSEKNNNVEKLLTTTYGNPPFTLMRGESGNEVNGIELKAVEDIPDNIACNSMKNSSQSVQSKSKFDGPTISASHDILTSSKDFFNKKLSLPNPAHKDVFLELLQNMNCVITQGGLASDKSSRMPKYILEIWIVDKDSSRIHLCQMVVTLLQMVAAISMAEKEHANRNNILNMLEIGIKQNQTLKVVMSGTIDSERFSEYFGGAPILSNPRYHIYKFYLDTSAEEYPKTLEMCANDDNPTVIHEEVAVLLRYIHKTRELEGAILVFLPDWDDLVKVQNLMYPSDDVVVHMVHSQSKDSEQYKIFSKPPPGKRKIILATEIEETIIDDLVYIVDTGMCKGDISDEEKEISVPDLKWISKANANQRAALSGSSGESYHFSFFTEERYHKFAD